MVEKEMLENTLGKRIHSDLMESSFRHGLHEEMRKAMVLFHDLAFKEYKRKAEIIDRDMKERKVSPYAPDPSTDPQKTNSRRSLATRVNRRVRSSRTTISPRRKRRTNLYETK